MDSPFGRFPESWAYRLSPASAAYHEVKERHPLVYIVTASVAFVALLFIGTLVCDLFGWPA